MNPSSRVVTIVLVLAAAGAGFFLLRHRRAPPPISRPVARETPATPAPPPSTPPATPAILHPVDGVPSWSPRNHSADQGDAFIKRGLVDLLGSRSVQSFLTLDGFARRVVATVNNLGTDDAAVDLWPVRQTPGIFETESRPGGSVISTANASRYSPFVRFAEAIDTQRAVGLYVLAYPLLQQAYEDIGFPGKYFNDRVVEVIDHLLATPDVDQPVKVKRIEADSAKTGAVRLGSALYVFEDPALEARTTGQKILLRMGRDNAARLKAKLTEIRHLIAKDATKAAPARR